MANCPNCGRPVTDAVPGRPPYHLADGTPIGSAECDYQADLKKELDEEAHDPVELKARGKPIFIAKGVNPHTPLYIIVEPDGGVSLIVEDDYFNATLPAREAARLSDAIRRAVFNHFIGRTEDDAT